MGMSLDGFIAGPDSRPDNPLGDGGTRPHEWAFGVESRQERQSIDGGQTNQDDDIVQANFSRAGAYIMGWQMFAEGGVGWPDPPRFRAPVFVLTPRGSPGCGRAVPPSPSYPKESTEPWPRPARPQATRTSRSGGADTVRQLIGAGLLDGRGPRAAGRARIREAACRRSR
ncbi:dihydrofolate reductase [Streptomyces fructofermentans]|uniref:dihydrofolate reductase n=1 Tax=Streptomyces fructofermentans TaxID=152141 RepID=UPI0033DBF6C3